MLVFSEGNGRSHIKILVGENCPLLMRKADSLLLETLEYILQISLVFPEKTFWVLYENNYEIIGLLCQELLVTNLLVINEKKHWYWLVRSSVREHFLDFMKSVWLSLRNQVRTLVDLLWEVIFVFVLSIENMFVL